MLVHISVVEHFSNIICFVVVVLLIFLIFFNVCVLPSDSKETVMYAMSSNCQTRAYQLRIHSPECIASIKDIYDVPDLLWKMTALVTTFMM